VMVCSMIFILLMAAKRVYRRPGFTGAARCPRLLCHTAIYICSSSFFWILASSKRNETSGNMVVTNDRVRGEEG